MVPILYGLAWPKATRQGGGTSMLAPRAPAAAAESPTKRRRVVLPLHHISRAHASSCQPSLMSPSWTSSLLSLHEGRAPAQPARGEQAGGLGRAASPCYARSRAATSA